MLEVLVLLYMGVIGTVIAGLETTPWTSLVCACVTAIFLCYAWATK